MSSPNMYARSFNKEDCTDPFCNCPTCQLKALPPPPPAKAKSSILSCCGAGKKAKSNEDARYGSSTGAGYVTTSVCKCASEGDASLKPNIVMSGRLVSCTTSATSATSSASAPVVSSGSKMENCDGCDCGCAAEQPCPAEEGPAREGWCAYIRRPFAWMFSFLPFGRLPRPDIAITCVPAGGTLAKKLGSVVGRKTKVVASALWTFLMNFIIFLLRVAIFFIDLSMVLLHALTHWYCVARRGWRTRTVSSICTEQDRRHYRDYD